MPDNGQLYATQFLKIRWSIALRDIDLDVLSTTVYVLHYSQSFPTVSGSLNMILETAAKFNALC